MSSIPQRTDLGARLRRLELAVSNLQRQSTLSSASISEGNLTIRRGGNIVVKDGGSITGEGDGELNWNGDAHFGGDTSVSGNIDVTGSAAFGSDLDVTGTMDVTGDAHFGGNLVIDGNTTLGGNLTWAPDAVPPEALSRRVEAATFSDEGSGNGNTRTESVTVVVPSWAQTVSCFAFGISSVAANPARVLSRVTIDGDDGPEVDAASDLALAVPAAHARDFSASGNFTVSVFGGLQGVTSSFWTQVIICQCVFIKSS